MARKDMGSGCILPGAVQRLDLYWMNCAPRQFFNNQFLVFARKTSGRDAATPKNLPSKRVRNQ